MRFLFFILRNCIACDLPNYQVDAHRQLEFMDYYGKESASRFLVCDYHVRADKLRLLVDRALPACALGFCAAVADFCRTDLAGPPCRGE